MPKISVIISTYNQPDLLVAALDGVFAQTVEDLEILIIGDSCEAETGVRLKQIKDQRVRYVNLPKRFGEQSGPNSVGMQIATSDVLAFLNQDDLWLPDHLAHALDCLKYEQAELFTGRAVFTRSTSADIQKAELLDRSPAGRDLSRVLLKPFYYFEPVSAWVMTKSAAQAVGSWQQAKTIYRTPLEDWMLRAWATGVAHTDSTFVTVIKNGTQVRPGKGGRGVAVLREWQAEIEEDGLSVFRAKLGKICRQIEQEQTGRSFKTIPGPEDFRYLARKLITEAALDVYQETGIDLMDTVCELVQLPKGWRLRGIDPRIKGRTLPDPPDMEEAVAEARRQLVDEGRV